MPLTAVLFSPENYPLILNRMDLPNEEMLRMKKALPNRGNLYFIPDFTDKNGVPLGTWVIVKQDYLDERFTYDKERIKFLFVTILRK